MAKKHFVLIHDAGHGKWIWDKLTPLLQRAGHVVTTVDLEASGDDPSEIECWASADEYTTPLLEVLKKLPEDEKVILVAHGFGGINAAIAMDTYPKKVEFAVFLNALMPDTTNRPSFVIEQYMKQFTDWKDCEFGCYSINKGAISKFKLGPTFVKDNLFPLSTFEDYYYAMSKIKTGSFFPEPLAIRKNFTKAGYGSIPKVFISSQQDTAIPTSFQRWEIKNALKEFRVIVYPLKEFRVNVYPLKGDHSPMYSDPKALLDVLKIINDFPPK